MQIVGAAIATGAIGVACAVVLHGAANTIDWCAWKLHRLACSIRDMHERQDAIMAQRWDAEVGR